MSIKLSFSYYIQYLIITLFSNLGLSVTWNLIIDRPPYFKLYFGLYFNFYNMLMQNNLQNVIHIIFDVTMMLSRNICFFISNYSNNNIISKDMFLSILLLPP